MTEESVRQVLSRIIARYEEWKVYGIWAAFLKENDEFIGWFALKPLPKTGEIEVGYRLLPQHWGKGYATEGTSALLKHGFDDLSLECVVAIAQLENKASRRVLEKAGFVEHGAIPDPFSKADSPNPVAYYRILKSDFSRAQN